jgi:catechol 2,3-dioxygenase-like lactoylglutathione lyase family enzyme
MICGMPTHKGLSGYDLMAFVNICNVEAAKKFYRDTLGLRLVAEQLPFGLDFDANGTTLRLAVNQKISPVPGTVMGWRVPDIDIAVADLRNAGVRFEHFQGLSQNEDGVWTTPTGAKVAWFKDPDGNILSLSQHPK